MKLLWTKDLKINTVHVSDVVRALWAVTASKEEGGLRKAPWANIEIYNLADKGDTGMLAPHQPRALSNNIGHFQIREL